MCANHQRFCLVSCCGQVCQRNSETSYTFGCLSPVLNTVATKFCRSYTFTEGAPLAPSLFRCGGVCWVEDAECGGGDCDGAKRRAVLYLLCLMTNDTLSLSSRYIVSDFLHPWEIWTLTIASFIRKLRLQRKLTKNVCALAVASLRLQFFIISRYHCACQSGQRCVFWKMALR